MPGLNCGSSVETKKTHMHLISKKH